MENERISTFLGSLNLLAAKECEELGFWELETWQAIGLVDNALATVKLLTFSFFDFS